MSLLVQGRVVGVMLQVLGCALPQLTPMLWGWGSPPLFSLQGKTNRAKTPTLSQAPEVIPTIFGISAPAA